jgi:hypothetical protein
LRHGRYSNANNEVIEFNRDLPRLFEIIILFLEIWLLLRNAEVRGYKNG